MKQIIVDTINPNENQSSLKILLSYLLYSSLVIVAFFI